MSPARFATIRAIAQRNIDARRADAADLLARAKTDPLAIGAVQRAAEARAAADAYEAAIRDIVDGMFGAE